MCNRILRFTFGATPVDLLVAGLLAELFPLLAFVVVSRVESYESCEMKHEMEMFCSRHTLLLRPYMMILIHLEVPYYRDVTLFSNESVYLHTNIVEAPVRCLTACDKANALFEFFTVCT